MKLLITGGAGFIGSNFVRHILQKYPDYKVTNLDKLTYAGNLENLGDIESNPNYKFIKGDICDAEVVNGLVKDADVIAHFAAESHVDRSIDGPSEFIQTNILGTQILLEAARTNNIKLFLHISTDEVYGSVEEGFSKESDLLEPNSPYSASKASADLLVRSYQATYGLPAIITRSSNNFGPYQYPEKVIPLFVTNLLKDKKVPLYGDGLNVRDWIYVLDNCEAIDFVLHKGKTGEAYNIASGNLLSNIELTKQILGIMGKPESFIEYVKDRLGHDRRYALDTAKLNQLGWQPRHSFKEGLDKTAQWYKSNEKWWKAIA